MSIGRLVWGPEQRAITNNDPVMKAWAEGELFGGTARSSSGQRVGTNEALELSTLYSCIVLRAEAMMSMPVDAYVSEGETRKPVPGARWMSRPNPEQDWPAYISDVMWNLDLYGNLYEAVMRDRSGRVAELWVLDAARVTVSRPRVGSPLEYRVDGQVYTGELRHRWFHRLPGRVTGSSPIEHAREAIGLGLAEQVFGAEFFGSGGVPQGVVTIPGDATAEQLQATKREFTKKSRLPKVLQGGMTYQTTAINPEESQFLESRRFSAAEVCAIYRVPPEFVAIGVQGSSLLYQNVSSSWLALIRRALMAPMRVLELSYSELLPPGQRFKFVPDVYLKPDATTRYSAHKTAIEGGWTTPNEVRALEDMEPHEFGDVLYAPKADTAEKVSAPEPEPEPVAEEGDEPVPFPPLKAVGEA